VIPLSPSDSAPPYLRDGRSEEDHEGGEEALRAGEYLRAQEILNELVQAAPENQAAKDLLTDVFEQLGSTLVVFDPRFEIMPGTAAAPPTEDQNDYEFGPYDNAAE